MCRGQEEAEDWRRSCHPFSVGECDAAAEMQNELAPCQGGHSPIQEVPTLHVPQGGHVHMTSTIRGKLKNCRILQMDIIDRFCEMQMKEEGSKILKVLRMSFMYGRQRRRGSQGRGPMHRIRLCSGSPSPLKRYEIVPVVSLMR